MLKLTTKARTLELLYNKLSTAKVLPFYYFSVEEYMANKETILDRIIELFSEDNVVVRSSAINEDGTEESNAGHFESLLEVETNSDSLQKAIGKVIASYDDNYANEVLIQPMLRNIECAGVAFTSDLDTYAPYYIVNYDSSGSTDSITSGSAQFSQTVFHYKNSPSPNVEWLKKLIYQLKELEKMFGNDSLDVEFAYDNIGLIYILQVRAISSGKKKICDRVELRPLLKKIYNKIKKLQRRHPNLLGNTTLFGVMPDWNPAEIIGIKPKKLALSLYKELITDKIWALQRDNYGYRNLTSHPLMVSYLGVPFIDVRVDFNSFIPKSLDDSIAEKLVNYYLRQLQCNPNYHDKIEFKIVHSCYFFNIEDRLNELEKEGFIEKEISLIKDSLLELTNDIICPERGFFKKDLSKIEELDRRYNLVLNSDLAPIDKIYWLTEDCKLFGTLPFAGIARAAFVGVQMLNSLVDVNIIDSCDYDKFMSSLITVSKMLAIDLEKLSNKLISKDDFLIKYGHLRPGTYDITSPRYDENFHEYFSTFEQDLSLKLEDDIFILTDIQKSKLDKLLQASGIRTDSSQLMYFIREAIEGREFSKLVFTRSLSRILKLISELGVKYSISNEDLAYLDFREVLKLYVDLDHRFMKDILEENIQLNKRYYQYTKAIKLPSLIRCPEDIYSFFLEDEEPNYISLNCIEAEKVLERDINSSNLKGKIVFIESADPGYDYLFTKDIAGLVTLYGGSNSHMAIRCAELGLPAIIGAGRKKFEEWSKYRIIRIDCLSKKVTTVV